MRTKVAIIGSAPDKKNAPFDDPSFDIWAISGAAYSESLHGEIKEDNEENGWNSIHRVDLLFDMHKRPVFAPKIKELNAAGCPIMMQLHHSDIPASVPYPVERVASEVGEEFSSSIAYMMALAIFYGYREMHLYGVNMATESEYAYQRPGVKYYLGVARGMGIKTRVPPESKLDKSVWRYGYDDHDRIKAHIDKRKAVLDDNIAKTSEQLEQLRGARKVCEGISNEIGWGVYDG